MQHLRDPFHLRDWFFIGLVVLLAWGVTTEHEKSLAIQAKVAILQDKVYQRMTANKQELGTLIKQRCQP